QRALLPDPGLAIGEADYLSPEEEKALLAGFNTTAADYPRDSTLVDLLHEQAERRGEATAVVYGDHRLSYGELEERTNRLGRYLRDRCGVKREELVGIQLDRSEWLIIAIIGVLKSGGAYVPIDPEYPQERKKLIAEDTGIRVLITEMVSLFEVSYHKGEVLAVDIEMEEQGLSEPERPVTGPEDLAYVMYTSGSTGIPKGVMVTHRNVVRLARSCNYIPLGEATVVLSTGAVSFDATTFEYWSTLLNGGMLVLCSKETLLDADRLSAEISRNG